MPRLLTPLALGALPVGEALDRLRVALAGEGDALLPVPTDVTAVQRLASLRPGSPLLDLEDDDADPTALVVATSGSTGEPKGALLPASALRASATATHDRLGGPGTWLLALATHHVAGVQVLVRSALAGTEPQTLDLAHGFDVDAFTTATHQLRRRAGGRRYTALVPTQMVRLLDAGGPPRDALATFDAVLIGGAAASPSLLQRAADAGVRVVTTYGMTETCGGCVYDGVPLDSVQVAVNGGGSSSAGRIRLGGPVVARGYRGRPNAGQFSHVDGTRWFTTNDLGRRGRGSSVLTVLGRADDVIVTGGEKVVPQSVEAVVSGVAGVAECLVVGVPDDRWGQRVVALLVASSGPDEVALLGEVRQAVKARLTAAAAPHDVVLVEALPASALGKPDRRAAAALATALLSRRSPSGGVR